MQRHLNLLKNWENINHVLHLCQFKCAHARTIKSFGLFAQCTAQHEFFFLMVSDYCECFTVATKVSFL